MVLVCKFVFLIQFLVLLIHFVDSIQILVHTIFLVFPFTAFLSASLRFSREHNFLKSLLCVFIKILGNLGYSDGTSNFRLLKISNSTGSCSSSR